MEYSIRISLTITRNADVHVTGSNFRFLSSESLQDFPGVGMGSVFIHCRSGNTHLLIRALLMRRGRNTILTEGFHSF